jgi:hypothetical protein
MPSLRRIQSALSGATERFAAELAAPLSDPPQWTEFEWTMAKAAAVLHGVTPLMASTLRWKGPPDWERFVTDQLRNTASRHQRLAVLLARIDEMSRNAAVPFIALKGAALHPLGLYAAGQRPMADIDLLAPERTAVSLSALLHSLGYEQTFSTWKHRILEPRSSRDASAPKPQPAFGEHEHAPIKIELHTHLSERLAVAAPDISEHVLTSALKPGLNSYPSQVALMTHLLLHAAGNIVARNLRLIHLHDIALLGYRFGMDDWERLVKLQVSGRLQWWALPALRLVQRYYRGCVPNDAISELSTACPRALNRIARRQSLSDVSYSRIAQEAFPGLAWTDSYAEKLECIRARINPGEEQRSMIEVIKAEPWASGSDWARRSRARRLLSRVLSRAPRLPTMYIVRAAIAASDPR